MLSEHELPRGTSANGVPALKELLRRIDVPADALTFRTEASICRGSLLAQLPPRGRGAPPSPSPHAHYHLTLLIPTLTLAQAMLLASIGRLHSERLATRSSELGGILEQLVTLAQGDSSANRENVEHLGGEQHGALGIEALQTKLRRLMARALWLMDATEATSDDGEDESVWAALESRCATSLANSAHASLVRSTFEEARRHWRRQAEERKNFEELVATVRAAAALPRGCQPLEIRRTLPPSPATSHSLTITP